MQIPADPRMFISEQEIEEKIAKAEQDVASGKMYSGEPMLLQGPYRATMEWRNIAQNNVNVHQTDAEIFVVLKGSGTLLLGGTLVNPRQAHTFPWEGPTLTAATVDGATPHKVVKGDMIMIPPNTPHTVSEVNGELVIWTMHLPMPPGTPAKEMSTDVSH